MVAKKLQKTAAPIAIDDPDRQPLMIHTAHAAQVESATVKAERSAKPLST